MGFIVGLGVWSRHEPVAPGGDCLQHESGDQLAQAAGPDERERAAESADEQPLPRSR